MTTRNAGLAAALATALALLGTGAPAQTTPSTGSTPGASSATPATGAQTPSATLNDTDKLFMLRSAQGDMAEIQTSQMALKKAKDSGVKQTAQRLIADHSQSLKEGSGLAVLLGLPMPKDPGVTNQAFAQKLMSAGGRDFDKQYMAGQAESHENVIALYNMELSQGQDPQVKAFAAKYLPGVEAHTQQIYQVAMSVNAPDANLRPSTPPMVAGVTPAAMGDMAGTSGASGTGASGMSGGASSSTSGSAGMTGGTGTTGASSGGTSTGTTGASGAGATGAGSAGTAGTGAGAGGASTGTAGQ